MDPRDLEIERLRAENGELRQTVAELAPLRQTVAELQQLVEALSARVLDLEHQLKLNSQNSSKPPSSDPPENKPAKKRRKGRKRGAQLGHEGKHRPLLPPDQVDSVEDHKPSACRGCDAPLDGEDSNPQRHQVTDLPPIQPTVHEHRLHALTCASCGTTTRARLPEGVSASAFGPRLTALVAVLSGTYRLSKRQIEQMLKDCFGVGLALGSVKALETRVSQALAKTVEEARRYVKRQASANLDETSWRHMNKRFWLWTAVAGLVSVFVIRASRGGQVAKDLLGAGYRGLVGSDRWSGYSWVRARFRQVCWAHLKRDFQKMADRQSKDARIGEELGQLRRQLFKYWHQVRAGTLSRSSFKIYVSPIRMAMRRLLNEGSKSRDEKIGKLCRGILKDETSMWTFVRRAGIDPTNNSAERAIRPAVIWRKVSYGTQSEAGREFCERMLTVSVSLRLQGRNVLEFVTESYRAAQEGRSGPSLLPITTSAIQAA